VALVEVRRGVTLAMMMYVSTFLSGFLFTLCDCVIKSEATTQSIFVVAVVVDCLSACMCVSSFVVF
jgi:hypothetical protein